MKEKINSIAKSAIRDVYAGALADIIEEKRVPLFAREILPRITNLDGVDVATRHVVYIKHFFDGKALITDLRPNTVPTLADDGIPTTIPLKWISFGVRTDINELDDIKTGKVYPLNRTEQAFRIVAETENDFLLKGFEKLGLKGFVSEGHQGIHVVTASKTWETATGEEIVGDILKMKVAMETGKKFVARTLVLPEKLDFILERPYTSKAGETITDAKSIREVLIGRKYFANIKGVIGIETAMGLDDIPSNMGFIDVLPLSIGKEYEEGRATITPIEEKISEFALIQPEAVVKLTGAI